MTPEEVMRVRKDGPGWLIVIRWRGWIYEGRTPDPAQNRAETVDFWRPLCAWELKPALRDELRAYD